MRKRPGSHLRDRHRLRLRVIIGIEGLLGARLMRTTRATSYKDDAAEKFAPPYAIFTLLCVFQLIFSREFSCASGECESSAIICDMSFGSNNTSCLIAKVHHLEEHRCEFLSRAARMCIVSVVSKKWLLFRDANNSRTRVDTVGGLNTRCQNKKSVRDSAPLRA